MNKRSLSRLLAAGVFTLMANGVSAAGDFSIGASVGGSMFQALDKDVYSELVGKSNVFTGDKVGFDGKIEGKKIAVDASLNVCYYISDNFGAGLLVNNIFGNGYTNRGALEGTDASVITAKGTWKYEGAAAAVASKFNVATTFETSAMIAGPVAVVSVPLGDSGAHLSVYGVAGYSTVENKASTSVRATEENPAQGAAAKVSNEQLTPTVSKGKGLGFIAGASLGYEVADGMSIFVGGRYWQHVKTDEIKDVKIKINGAEQAPGVIPSISIKGFGFFAGVGAEF